MNESSILGVSVRALLATIIIVACCGLAVWTKNMEVLKDLSLVAVSFYFGQKNQGGTNVQVSNPDSTVTATVTSASADSTK